MVWNPKTYHQFKSERAAPFFDLLQLVNVRKGLRVIDLGCGTGELTRKLADHLPDACILGIDSSDEMLKEANQYSNQQVRFENSSIENQLNRNEQWDLIFSNAAIQWVPDHLPLFEKMRSALLPGGQLAIQIPSQTQNRTNQLLESLGGEEPYKSVLQSWVSSSPVLPLEAYAKMLFKLGSRDIAAFEKIYPIIVPDTVSLFKWVSGTALVPYLERLGTEMSEAFVRQFKEVLSKEYPDSPVFYPFKRILLAATF